MFGNVIQHLLTVLPFRGPSGLPTWKTQGITVSYDGNSGVVLVTGNHGNTAEIEDNFIEGTIAYLKYSFYNRTEHSIIVSGARNTANVSEGTGTVIERSKAALLANILYEVQELAAA